MPSNSRLQYLSQQHPPPLLESALYTAQHSTVQYSTVEYSIAIIALANPPRGGWRRWWTRPCRGVYFSMYVYVYNVYNIYIYIYIERERDVMCYVYIYIYIYREREMYNYMCCMCVNVRVLLSFQQPTFHGLTHTQ